MAFVEVETIQVFLFVAIVKNASVLKLVVVVRKFPLFASSSICVVGVVIGGNGEEDIIGDIIVVIVG